ncbi:MAG: flagellar biosynthetic protein FliR [Thermodesulfobacteriota bacterium]
MSTDLIQWSSNQFPAFLLVLMRVAPLLFMMPLFNARNLPLLLKVGLSLSISLILWPTLHLESSSFSPDIYGLGFLLFSEFLIGFLLGLSVRLVLGGIQLAGEFAGFQMGFGMANVLDPQSVMEGPLIARFYYLLGLLIFLSIDGHHWFFRALIQSFHLLRPGEFVFSEGLFRHLFRLSAKMFWIALQIVAPVTATLILVQFGLAVMARMIPQMNLLISSFPLTIGLGLFFLGLSIELLSPFLRSLLEESGRGLVTTLLPLMKR